MRSFSFFILVLFALVHLLGFLKAYGLMNVHEISAGVSHSWGALWLLGSLLMASTAVLYHNENRHWFMMGIMAVVVSQILIFNFWDDAMFGSLINVLLIEMLCSETSKKIVRERR